ncbi:MAG: WD40/YVTN/BNR-like repeat-containing protein [Alphaproteobacteria bacterium]
MSTTKKILKRLLGTTALIGAGLFAFAATAEMDADLFDGMAARSIGPAGMSGRVSIVDAVASDPNIIFVGSATGGVWRSTDGGLTFQPIFDDMDVASIGALAINQQNPDIVWVGSGEGNPRNSTSIGAGVYKSIDGGDSWTKVGLPNSERINWIELDPTNADIAYVAALGTLWGPNEERGLYKTTDGGETWNRILYVDDTTGATDIKMDPSNPNKLFAAMWQFTRLPYHFTSGGPGSSLWRSLDGGESWTEITTEDGLPGGEWGRANFDIAPSNPDKVYLVLETEGNNVAARSDDGGVTWQVTNETINNTARPFYYTEIKVDPENENRVYNIQSTVWESIDAGKTFNQVPGINCCGAPNAIHIDVHSMWINPNDHNHIIIGDDGGLGITRDHGATWRYVDNLPLAQFYHIKVDNDLPYHIYGGLQDNGSWRGPSEVWENGGIRNFHWQEVSFGDGFDTVPDPDDSMRGYSMFQGGGLITWNLNTGEQRFIPPASPDPEVELRFNWSAGIAQDPFDSGTIYYGSQFVHKSTDRGLTWEVISGDLTTNNPDWQTYNESGGFTPDVTAAEFYTTIISIAPSPVQEGVIWVGTDDGRLHVTQDGGATWESLDGRARGVPDNTWIPHIEPSPHDASVAFVVYDNHRRSDMDTYVYRADNFGRRFTNIGSNDLSGYALSVQQDHVDPNLLFLGTEFGLYLSTNAGDDWMKWTAGVPTVSVMDMAIQARESDLVLGTHGRAIFVIDDYSGLRGLSEDDFSSRLKLLSMTDGIEYNTQQSPSMRFDGATGYRAPNQPRGVMITFIASGDDLAHPDADAERARKIAARTNASEDDAPGSDGKVTVEVRNSDGDLIRTFKRDVRQGINRITWGMERDGVKQFPGGQPNDDGTRFGGPDVIPGAYEVTLKFDDQEVSGMVNVSQDPRTSYSAEALQANVEAAMEVTGMFDTAAEALQRVLDARSDIELLKTIAEKAQKDAPEDEEASDEEAVEGDEETKTPLETFLEDAGAALEKTTEIEKMFTSPPDTKGFVDTSKQVTNYIGTAGFFINSTFDAPSATTEVYLEVARVELAKVLDVVNAFFAEEVTSLREQAGALDLSLLKPVEPLGDSE